MTSLTLVPCAGFEHDCGEQTSTTNHEDHSGNHENEGCTPFCICSYCQTNMVLDTKFVLDTDEPLSVVVCYCDAYSDMVTNPYLDVLFHPPIG